ncbi:hypothetical protein [Halomonas sp. THAF12]|uniref:hypothetical protein n=1 Tax=Halomonas sp. THAF12 TaxID=2587849 RepID=UPI0012694689|nr:hypothetical protein [Halomonas sp. THAF12]
MPKDDHMPSPTRFNVPRTLTPEQIVEKLRRRPYDRAAREAADLIEEMLAEREAQGERRH